MCWSLFETKIQWDPHIDDSPTRTNLPQLDEHSLGGLLNQVKDERKIPQAWAQISAFQIDRNGWERFYGFELQQKF